MTTYEDSRGSWQYDVQALNEYEQEEREIRKRLRQKRKLTLLQKILLWFRKLFGGEDEERIRKIELRHRLEIIEIEKAQLMQQKEEADKKKQEYEILLGQKRKKRTLDSRDRTCNESDRGSCKPGTKDFLDRN